MDLIEKAKKSYFIQQIDDCESHPKKLFQIVDKLLGWGKSITLNILMHLVWLNPLTSFSLPKFLEFEENCQYWRTPLMRCIVHQSIHYSNLLLQNCTLLNQPLLMKSQVLSRKPQKRLATWYGSNPNQFSSWSATSFSSCDLCSCKCFIVNWHISYPA